MDVLKYFQLKEKPFNLGPDPRYLFLSEQVKEALGKCEYMARERVGPLYMFGPVGSGKTSILRRLRERLSQDKRYLVTFLVSPNVKTANAFLRVILESFDVKTERAYDQSLKSLETFLTKKYHEGKIPVLLVDEAQNLNKDSLRLIHYLLNYETATEKLLQIVLSGQEDLIRKMVRYQELASRMFPIGINAMSYEELEEMINFRWMVAGGKTPPFTKDAYKSLFVASKGLPRTTVKICDEVLRDLVYKKKKVATKKDVEKIAKELFLDK